jgi:hypothetical protein
VVLLDEGDRVPADCRLLRGALEVDASALTGESLPVERSADAVDTADRKLDSPVLVFSGTGCLGGSAVAVVYATGAHTEIGRIAALSSQVSAGASPLERQMRRVAWLVAAVRDTQRPGGLDDYDPGPGFHDDPMGDAGVFGQCLQPRDGLLPVCLVEHPHRAGHKEPRELDGLTDPSQIGDHRAARPEMQRPQPDLEVFPHAA